jgi:mono/diheme cytochrome c family protein
METGNIGRSLGSMLLCGAATAALAQAPAADPRGELLYATHCVGCHTTQVHWRAKKLASDYATLLAQVARWQEVAKLGWSADDVDAVARYLNGLYYRFPVPERRTIGGAPAQIARRP